MGELEEKPWTLRDSVGDLSLDGCFIVVVVVVVVLLDVHGTPLPKLFLTSYLMLLI